MNNEDRRQLDNDRETLYISLRDYVDVLAKLHERRCAEIISGLREHSDAKWNAHDQIHELLAENIRTALTAQDRRLDGMNEFRQSLEDMNAQSVSREVFDTLAERTNVLEHTIIGKEAYDRLAEKITDLEKSGASQDALDTQRRESDRSRRSLSFALIAVGAAALINFLLNVYQGAKGTG